MQATLMETFAKKSPNGWTTYATSFRDGCKNCGHVLLRYRPR